MIHLYLKNNFLPLFSYEALGFSLLSYLATAVPHFMMTTHTLFQQVSCFYDKLNYYGTWFKPQSKTLLLNSERFLRNKVSNLKIAGHKQGAKWFFSYTQPWLPTSYAQPESHNFSNRKQSVAIHNLWQYINRGEKGLLFEKQLLFIHIIWNAPGHDHHHLWCGFCILSVQHTVFQENGNT